MGEQNTAFDTYKLITEERWSFKNAKNGNIHHLKNIGEMALFHLEMLRAFQREGRVSIEDKYNSVIIFKEKW